MTHVLEQLTLGIQERPIGDRESASPDLLQGEPSPANAQETFDGMLTINVVFLYFPCAFSVIRLICFLRIPSLINS